MKKLLFGIISSGLICSVSAMAAGSDELWEVTSKMEMPGMPFAMPAQTVRVCMKKGHANDPNSAIPKNNGQDCKITDTKISGNKSSWKMKCEGTHPMTGSGEITNREGSYSGKMEAHSGDGEMTMVYEGKRVGTCQAK
jgi:hypothetical protein